MLKIVPSIKTPQINKAVFVERKLSEKYEAEDKKTGEVNIPHFLRASQKVKEYQANGTLEEEYKKLRKDFKHGQKCE